MLDTLPAVVPNSASAFGPIMACNCGYGKKTTVELFAKQNFKVVAIANSIGSEHPIVGTSAVKEYTQKIHQNQALQLNSAEDSDSDSNDGNLDLEMSSFWDSIGPFCLSDNPNTLFGPKMPLAQSSTDDAFFAYGYHDIFDKKVAQKLLRFFLSVSPMFPKWFNHGSLFPKITMKLSFPDSSVNPIRKQRLILHWRSISWTNVIH
jgi:hypothetical protein